MDDSSQQKQAGKYANGLLRALERLAESGASDDFGVVLDGLHLACDEAEAVRLINRAIGKYRDSMEYDLMKYKLTSDALNIALWDMDVVGGDSVNPNNQFTWSPEFRHMLGFTDTRDFPDLLQSWSNRLHPEDRARTLDAFVAHLNDHTGKTPYDIEYRLMLKNGDYRNFHAFGTTLRDDAGIPLRVAGALMDITEKKQMREDLESALSETSKTLDIMKSILNNLDAMIYVSDLETYEILFINERMKQHFGILGLESDMVGKPCYTVLQQGMTERCDFCPRHQLDKEPDKVIVWEEHNAVTKCYYRKTDRYIDWPGDKKVHIQYSIDLTVVAQTQKKLERSQKMLSAVNSVASFLLNSNMETFESALYQSMKLLAEAVNVDRVYIWENYVDGGRLHCAQIHEYSENVKQRRSKGITCGIAYGDNIARWEKKLSNGQCINNVVHEMPPEEQALLSPQGIVSILVVPVFINDQFWGFVGFDDCRHERLFTAAEEAILRSSSLLFANAMIRNEMLTKLHTTSLQLESALEQETTANKHIKLMLDSNPLICLLRDENNNILDCNMEALKAFGVSTKSELISNFHKFYPEFQPDGSSSAERAKATLKSLLEKQRHDSAEWTLQNIQGEQFPVETTYTLIQWEGLVRILTYSRDLSEMKAKEQELSAIAERERKAELQKEAALAANEIKSEFLARMSHELRTPLNAVIGFLDLELHKELPQDSTDNLEMSLDACNNLLYLINDILDISKIEAGHFELSYDNYHLAYLINAVLSLNSFHLESESVSFRLELDENLPSILHGDPLRIKQVLNNLLSNAFKYTEKGMVTFAVGLATGEKEMDGCIHIRFSVKDTGKGIKAENLENLFSSYTRFDSKTMQHIEGTGLGLAISKNFVEMMDGRIHVESEYGKGSEFFCIIPQIVVNPAPLDRQSVYNNLNRCNVSKFRRHKRHSVWQNSQMPYARVLVVDDVKTNLAVARGMLQRYGMTVDCVAGGQQAIDLLRSGEPRYNAVFMDHMMPGMDGIGALRHIRGIDSEYARSVPVIIFTANVIAGNEKWFLEQGFQDFLAKPIDPSKLNMIVNKWIKDPLQEVSLSLAGADSGEITAPAAGHALAYSVEGLDIHEAIARFGSETVFFDVLQSYAANTPELLEQIRRLSKKDMAEFAVTAHGIKGASYAVGANALGDMAKELEHAATGKKWRKAQEKLPAMLEAAAKLLRGIDTLLHEVMPAAVPEENKPLKPAPDAEDLAALYRASLSCSYSAMHENLEKLEQYRYQSGGELVPWLRARVDAFDYDLINERLAQYSP